MSQYSSSGASRVSRAQIGDVPRQGLGPALQAPGLIAPDRPASGSVTQLGQVLEAIRALDGAVNAGAGLAQQFRIDRIEKQRAIEEQNRLFSQDAENYAKQKKAEALMLRGVAVNSAESIKPTLIDSVEKGQIKPIDGESLPAFSQRVLQQYVPTNMTPEDQSAYHAAMVEKIGPSIQEAYIRRADAQRKIGEEDLLVSGSNAVFSAKSPEDITNTIDTLHSLVPGKSRKDIAEAVIKPAMERAAADGRDPNAFDLLAKSALEHGLPATEVDAARSKYEFTAQTNSARSSNAAKDQWQEAFAKYPADQDPTPLLKAVQEAKGLNGNDRLSLVSHVEVMQRQYVEAQRAQYKASAELMARSDVGAALASGQAWQLVGEKKKVPTPGGDVDVPYNDLIQQQLDEKIKTTPLPQFLAETRNNGIKYDQFVKAYAGADLGNAIDKTSGKVSPAFVRAAQLHYEMENAATGSSSPYLHDKPELAKSLLATTVWAKYNNNGVVNEEAVRNGILAASRWNGVGGDPVDAKEIDKAAKGIADDSGKDRGIAGVREEIANLASLMLSTRAITSSDAIKEATKIIKTQYTPINGWLTYTGKSALNPGQYADLLSKASARYYESNKKYLGDGITDDDISFRPGFADGTWIPYFPQSGNLAPLSADWIITDADLQRAFNWKSDAVKKVAERTATLFGVVADDGNSVMRDHLRKIPTWGTITP